MVTFGIMQSCSDRTHRGLRGLSFEGFFGGFARDMLGGRSAR